MNCNLFFFNIFNRIMSNSSFRFHSFKKQDMREYVGMVVLYLQKAFDTVNHKIIINKLKALGLNQIALNCVFLNHI